MRGVEEFELNSEMSGVSATSCETQLVAAQELIGEAGIRTPQETPGKTALSEVGDAKSGALGEIIEAWDTLPDAIKTEILALVRAAVGQGCGSSLGEMSPGPQREQLSCSTEYV